MFEEGGGGQFGAELGADAGHDGEAHQRGAAEFEERIVGADLVDAEQFLPDPRDTPFGLGARRPVGDP